MLRRAAYRALLCVPTLLGVALLVFFLSRLLPGDVVTGLVGPDSSASPERLAELRRLLGLDAPLHVQLWRFFAGLAHGDLGTSLRTGRKVATDLGLRGPVKIDFKRDPKTGRFLVLELNPRFNLWNYLGAACGVNLLRLAYEDLVGGSAAPAVLRRHDVRWLSLENDLRAFVRDYHHDGDLSWLGWLGSLSHRKVYDIFAWDDPLPAVMSSLRYGRALGRRLLRELRH